MVRAKTLFPDLAAMLKRELGGRVDQDAEDFLDLIAEDGTMEFPYAPPGRPKRVTGHADLAAYLEPLTHLFTMEWAGEPTLHWTQDPDCVIFEFSVVGRVTSTGQTFDQSYIEVITLEGGKIKTFRDYWNPLVLQNLRS